MSYALDTNRKHANFTCFSPKGRLDAKTWVYSHYQACSEKHLPIIQSIAISLSIWRNSCLHTKNNLHAVCTIVKTNTWQHRTRCPRGNVDSTAEEPCTTQRYLAAKHIPHSAMIVLFTGSTKHMPDTVSDVPRNNIPSGTELHALNMRYTGLSFSTFKNQISGNVTLLALIGGGQLNS